MSTASLIIGLALLIVALWIAGAPLLDQSRRLQVTRRHRAEPAPAGDREAVLVALRDLDFDHQLGKVGDDDYDTQRTALLAQAAAAMPARAPERAAARSTQRAAQRPALQRRTCQACGAVLRPDDRFCVVCGEPAGSTRTERTCPTCARVARPDELFCPACGTALAPAKQPTAAARL
jgi:RNA polymerase subunit RPABC4/transcription elongation factor Spt4